MANGFLFQLIPVFIDIIGNKLTDYIFSDQPVKVQIADRRIERHEHVRDNTSSTVYRALFYFRKIFQGIIHYNTVSTDHFSAPIPVIQLGFIIFFAFRIRFLYTSPRRRIIVGYRQPDHRSVGQRKLSLHQAFPERPPAHQYAPIPILNSSGNNLTGRSRIAVDQYDHPSTLQESYRR